MAERIEWFDVTVTAGTTKAAPAETATTFDQGLVDRIEITIPDGHAGLTGIRLLQAHQPVIPSTSGSFIVGNDRTIGWDLHGYLDNGSWSVECYNTDQYDHAFHLAFLISELGSTTTLTFAPVQGLVVAGGAAPVDFGSTGVAADIPAFTAG